MLKWRCLVGMRKTSSSCLAPLYQMRCFRPVSVAYCWMSTGAARLGFCVLVLAFFIISDLLSGTKEDGLRGCFPRLECAELASRWHAVAKFLGLERERKAPGVGAAEVEVGVFECLLPKANVLKIGVEVGGQTVCCGAFWVPVCLAAAENGIPLKAAFVAMKLALALGPDGEYGCNREVCSGQRVGESDPSLWLIVAIGENHQAARSEHAVAFLEDRSKAVGESGELFCWCDGLLFAAIEGLSHWGMLGGAVAGQVQALEPDVVKV